MRPTLTLTAAAAAATLFGSVGLHSLFVGFGWFPPVLGAVTAVALMGLLVRRLRAPVFLGLPAGMLALLLFLTVAFTRAEAFLWVVPTPGSLAALVALMREGWQAAGRYAAPVPLLPGITALVALGVGAVAAAVDFLAVRLRRVAPAGLPLLAMYSVPAAVREDSVSWPAFALGALGFLALLLVDAKERLRGWGRPVAGGRKETQDIPDITGLTATGRRIGFTAVVIAVLLPTAVPGIQPRGLFGLGGAGGRGAGSTTVTTPDPLVSLKRELTRQDDAVVLTYWTDDTERPDYLRLFALDQFDGDRWTYAALRSTAKDQVKNRQLPTPPGLSGTKTRRVNTQIAVDRRVSGMTFLPLPYAPHRIKARGDWRVDAPSLMVFSLGQSAAGQTFTVQSLRPEPSRDRLASLSLQPPPEEITTRFLEVPRQVPDRVRRRAESITSGSATPYDRAMDLQRWFTEPGRFTYDLSAQPPRHTSDLIDFLETNRRGYCEQFAAAMAVLARTLGIPARVAMGYTSGTQDASGRWTVRARDAHAWPELYFEGAGWLRFEPTPGGAAGQGTASTPAYAHRPTATEAPQSSRPDPQEPKTAPATGPTPAATGGPRRPDDLGRAFEPDPAQQDEQGTQWLLWMLPALLLLVLLAVPKLVRELSRRNRWMQVKARGAGGAGGAAPPGGGSDPGTGPLASGGRTRSGSTASAAHTAWMELRADAIDHGLPWRLSESPRATGRRLAEHLHLTGAAEEALQRIVMAEERARYAPDDGPRPAGPAGRDQTRTLTVTLRTDSRLVRKAIAESVDQRTRWQARLLPRSTVTELRGGARQVVRRTDRFTETGFRFMNRLSQGWRQRTHRSASAAGSGSPEGSISPAGSRGRPS